MAETNVTRREMLKMTAVAGAGAALGLSGFGIVEALTKEEPKKNTSSEGEVKPSIVPFYGTNQAGILTPHQTYLYIAAFNILTTDKKKVIELLKTWTALSALMSEGKSDQTYENAWFPPKDTGDALDLEASNLTFTFGFGTSFFKKDGVDRFGISSKIATELHSIPKMPRDDLKEPYIEGDICVQVCADDQQVAFHAIRNLIKNAVGIAEVKWMQSGFLSVPKDSTPRNLFGFKDGTANIDGKDTAKNNNIIWANEGEPNWMKNGTYMACRKIQMFLEVWDRTPLAKQEDTFGRKKLSGAPYGAAKELDKVDLSKLPPESHTALANATKLEIYRRAFSYTEGFEPQTGIVNAGLMFISFQKNPDEQFIPMLKALSERDILNEYAKHIGSAMFACPGGIKKGEYVGQKLLES